MATHHHLYGSCACERNQYAIEIPHSLTQETAAAAAATTTNLAHVFFDNSRANRRAQAAPLTAWLRVPLAWYHSHTRAFYPDESHASIRRTFYSPIISAAPSASVGGETTSDNNSSSSKQVRKQFCGYCGTHLNAWLEDEDRGQWMDVTLGSLWGESLGVLEGLGLLEDSESGSSRGSSAGGEEEEEEERRQEEEASATRQRGVWRQSAARSMSNRGLPFFEDMLEDSRLSRIKRRSGAHVGVDGRTVEWHVVELDGGEDGGGDAVMDDRVEAAETSNGNKRLKLGD